MTRRSVQLTSDNRNVARPKTPPNNFTLLTPPVTPKKSPPSPGSPRQKSPRNPHNTHWALEQKRKAFLEHLQKWSLNHDSSAHFHGTISIWNPEGQSERLALGKSVKCVLTDGSWTDARKHVVVRLFEPREKNGRYRLVLRSGAGWTNARQFLDKEYFSMHTTQHKKLRYSLDLSLQDRSEALGPKPDDKNTVTIRPLFHLFSNLPVEVQHSIFGIIINKTSIFQAAGRDIGFSVYEESSHKRARANSLRRKSRHRSLRLVESLTKLGTIFKISRSLNDHVIPWIYQTTSFHFENQGFTNFMWLSGPEKRPLIKQITLSFGTWALVHSIRWFAPDEIFSLFDPPMSLKPPAMQYFWRCQIRDLARELHLSVLTIDIHKIPENDVPIIARILPLCFGNVGRVRFVSAGDAINPDDERLKGLRQEKSWEDLCKDAFVRYRNMQYHDQCFSTTRKAASVEALEREMAENRAFFGRTNDSCSE